MVPGLLLPEQPTLARRIVGLAVSVPLHAAAFALLAFVAVRPGGSDSPIEEQQLTVAYVAAPDGAGPDDVSTGDRTLPDEPGAILEAVEERVDLGIGSFSFDVAKIRTRTAVLFPFLTLDLLFLNDLAADAADEPSQRGLTNPYAAAPAPKSKPPLAISDERLQQITDRAWSRRNRWARFSEIAGLAQAHHPGHGRPTDILRAYLDRNILQPFCDHRVVTGPPRRETIIRDPMFWGMLENVADHADFIDFVRGFAREHRSSRTTTELLFLLDELAQASRDALLILIVTDPARDLTYTSSANREAFGLAAAVERHYRDWLWERRLHSPNAIRAQYDDLRLRLLSTIVDSTPNGYRAGDAQFLAGEIAFEQGNWEAARQWWDGITPDSADSYVTAYTDVREALRSPRGADVKAIRRALDGVRARWRMFSYERLRQFGHACDTF